MKENMQNIKIAPTFFIIKNVVKIKKNVKKRKKCDINKKRKKRFLHLWFFVGIGKPKLCTKFEVAGFCHCINIKGNPQILGNTPSLGRCLPFLLRMILSLALANSCLLYTSPSPRD